MRGLTTEVTHNAVWVCIVGHQGPVAEHEPAVVWGVRPPEIEMKIHVLAEETSTIGPAAKETLTAEG